MIRSLWLFAGGSIAVLACSSTQTLSPASDSPAKSDCSLIGCAPPPPCGQECTAACGCCYDSCIDAAADAGSDAPDAADASGSCGLSLSFTTDQAACQAWGDQNCCADEQACAQDVSCAAEVTCINACPSPRTETCIEACGDIVPAALDTFASCTKSAPPPVGATCAWP